MMIMPIITGSSSLLFTLTLGHRPLYAVGAMLVMIASVAVGATMFLVQYNGPRKRIREQRERYVDYLDQLRETVRGVAATQRAESAFRHPAPELLLEPARSRERRWERRSRDSDHLQLRLGLGTRPLARPLSLKADTSDPLVVYDPVCQGLADQLVELYAHVPEEPLVVDLREHGMVSVVGDRATGRAMARAMVAQLVTFTAPEEVRLGVVRHPRLLEEWDWLKWLPHNAADDRHDGPLSARLVGTSTIQLAELLQGEFEQRTSDWQKRRGKPPGPGTRRLVLLVDGEHQPTLSGLAAEAGVSSLADLGIHVILLVGEQREEPDRVDLRLTVDETGAVAEDRPEEESPEPSGERRTSPAGGDLPLRGQADQASVALLTSLARILSPLRLAAGADDDGMFATVGLPEILGVQDVAELDPRQTWRPRSANEFLRVPIGMGPAGGLVHLDLKESAFGGMGPHGLVVGATGSGKSEMLRTLVTSLVIGHPPEQLALLLVDFKGGATFADMDRLPHSAGLITNLADDDGLVTRFREAMYGELTRRQQLLKDAGNLPNLHAYEQLRSTQRPDLDPLPHLLVIIDEFSELLTAHPDFAELFVAIGRIGRSIGVHLLLSTQRLESGKIKGLESHLSYRLGLRTFSEAESREVIGVTDAYHLPPEPGSGYLKVDTSVFERFKAAMVSSPYVPPTEQSEEEQPMLPVISYNGIQSVLRAANRDTGTEPTNPQPSVAEETTSRTILQVAVDRLVAAGAAPVRPVWVAPLPATLSLGELLAEPDGSLPVGPATEPDPDEVRAVVGRSDFPREQRQEAATVDFTGTEGNLVVVGGPQSGKSTLLRTLIASLAWTYPPGRVVVYGIDFGGGGLAAMEELPHVAGVAGRASPERVRRVLSDVSAQLDQREQLCRDAGLDSPTALRRARAAGEVRAEVPGDVFLLIDGWASVREAFGDADELVQDIATRGPAVGVHTVLTGAASSQIRSRMQALFGGRLELRLTDPFDSGVDRKLAEAVPKDTPGRGLLPSEANVQFALPRVDGRADDDDLTAGVRDLVSRVRQRWPKQRPVRRVHTLPTLVSLPELERSHSGRGLILGMAERSLAPVAMDDTDESHLVVFGDPQTGKSTLLRGMLHQIIQRPTQEVGVLLVDYRRAHLGVVPQAHQLGYCTTAEQTKAAATDLARSLKERMPTSDVTPRQLRERSWWSGLEVFVVVDDYDFVGGRTNPLSPLAELLPYGRDIGFHVILARRTGGAARAMFEPVLQGLSDLASPGLLFSGDRAEGRLANGVAARQLPPGRALLARRGQKPEMVQVGWTDPPE
ncbi:type VII secretion protein EccCa [Lipingzhangella sp. LS1_29]|uniref:Type VII secretion protein EccCa n=1 Tax=Lipingzhangella rawalii TaxID=2055835 RepID=A0ABU2H4D2_9ACTN|nr:type VII secretion protein EccCa [Lipingzhangella rawalii]MDS1270157.1 type VII secretion protein EccCa [Lipingzhangella rawalii]